MYVLVPIPVSNTLMIATGTVEANETGSKGVKSVNSNITAKPMDVALFMFATN